MITTLAQVAQTSPGIDSQVAVAFIAAVGGIVTTWLTVKYKDKIVKKNTPSKPKDRMDTIFEGYEKLILQQQGEIDRKQLVIENLEKIVGHLEQELATTKELLSATKDEVAETKRTNSDLKAVLKKMRKDYGVPTHDEPVA